MAFTAASQNAMLDSLGNTFFVSAHTGAPGETGANEVSGGSYARQSITFAAAAAGNRDSTNQPAIPIPAGTTVVSVGLFDAATGGNFIASFAINETFTGAGNLNVTDYDLTLSNP